MSNQILIIIGKLLAAASSLQTYSPLPGARWDEPLGRPLTDREEAIARGLLACSLGQVHIVS